MVRVHKLIAYIKHSPYIYTYLYNVVYVMRLVLLLLNLKHTYSMILYTNADNKPVNLIYSCRGDCCYCYLTSEKQFTKIRLLRCV